MYSLTRFDCTYVCIRSTYVDTFSIRVGLCAYMRYIHTYTQGQNEEYVLNQVRTCYISEFYYNVIYVRTYIPMYVHTYYCQVVNVVCVDAGHTIHAVHTVRTLHTVHTVYTVHACVCTYVLFH